MRITSIPQVYRHVNRWREILSVLSKYGLANWISRLDLEFAKEFFRHPGGEALARQRPETRIRLALTELGPTFIKLGQILSTRVDLVGVELAGELEHLQDDTPADAFAAVRTILEEDLGCPIAEHFADFCETPLASASIGQVHRARLESGEVVAVKVRHAGIEDKIRVDLDILHGLAHLAERIPEFVNYRPVAVVAEFQRILRRELDFTREQRHLQQFARVLAHNPAVRIPKTYPDYCTPRVLTLEYLPGVKLCEAARESNGHFDLAAVSRRGADLYLEMIFTHGYYHADPHPGNILILPENVIGLLDFGMVGRLDDRLREDVEELILSIGQQDPVRLTSIITRVGEAPKDLDQAALGLDVADYVAHYASQPLGSFDLSGALSEMIEIVRRYQITLPPRLAMLIKVLVMLEGTGRLVSPQFNLMEVIRPYQRRMLWRRMSPVTRLRKMRRLAAETEHLVEALPRGLFDILQQVQTGKFDVHLDHRGLEPSVNRLVLGMLTSALFLGSALMLSHKVPPVLSLHWVIGDLSLLGAMGAAVSMALGLRLLRAINKSGHLDRRE